LQVDVLEANLLEEFGKYLNVENRLAEFVEA
jgi:hypothetical protein